MSIFDPSVFPLDGARAVLEAGRGIVGPWYWDAVNLAHRTWETFGADVEAWLGYTELRQQGERFALLVRRGVERQRLPARVLDDVEIVRWLLAERA